MDVSKIPIHATTQEHLDIEDIRDDIVLLKDGSCCLVLKTTALNFGLLSETEQDATILAYAGILNSLTFPIQILIRSKKSDVSDYIFSLKKQEDNQSNLALKNQISKYRKFIETTVKENNTLEKKFYIVIPFSSLELGIKSAAGSMSKRKGLPFQKEYIIQKAKTTLLPKKDHLVRLLNRLGLKSETLNTQGLIELFFSIYNPEQTGVQKPTDNYQSGLVEPATTQTPNPQKTF
jgi:hypothetical protein